MINNEPPNLNGHHESRNGSTPPPLPPRRGREDDTIEKKATPLAYKIVSIVIVIAMLATLIFPALVMLRRNVPENCHRGPLGPIHCHEEPIDHDHSIFT